MMVMHCFFVDKDLAEMAKKGSTSIMTEGGAHKISAVMKMGKILLPSMEKLSDVFTLVLNLTKRLS